jgi:hypothetical protein
MRSDGRSRLWFVVPTWVLRTEKAKLMDIPANAAEGLGFRGEALLRNHVKATDGSKHDIALLSHDVARVQSQMEAYGLTDAL